MKRRIIILLFLLFAFLPCIKALSKPDSIQAARVFTLCKVWGLVKYYHTDVVKGKIDWDNAFIDHWKNFKKIEDNEGYNEFILQLLSNVEIPQVAITKSDRQNLRNNKLENLKQFEFLKDTSLYLRKINFQWIVENNLLFDKTKDQLIAVLLSYKPSRNKNFKIEQGAVINHKDNAYGNIESLTQGHYMLGLFRYWNIINYFFPYKYLMDNEWDTSLTQTIPLFLRVTTCGEYVNAINILAAKINDSHGDIEVPNTHPEEILALPFVVDFVDDNLVVMYVINDSLSTKYGISLGTSITHINNRSIDSLFNDFAMENAWSTSQALKENFVYSVWYNPDYEKNILIGIKEGNSNKTVTLSTITASEFYHRYRQNRSKANHKIINDSIGYIDFPALSFFEFGKVYRKFKKLPYLIIDCRGYGSSAILRLTNRLSKKPCSVALYYYPLKKYPGIFKKAKPENYYFSNYFEMLIKLSGIVPSSAGKLFPTFKTPYQGKVIVLINERAISFGETVPMTIKAYRPDAVFIGSPTQGANGNISTAILPGELEAFYTGLDWRFPDGSQLQRKGIQPDISVERTIQGIRKHKDEVLERAIKYIETKN